MMNRPAKDGARSSRHYCGEGILTHPSHQGVCERHGTEDLDVTPGGLVVFPGGTGAMSLSLLKFVGQASLVDDAMLPS